MNTLRIMFLAVGCKPQELTVAFGDSDGEKLRTMSSLVGGFVEHLIVKPDDDKNYMAGGIDCWLNEEGKLNQLPANFAIPVDGPVQDIVVGNVFFTRYTDEGETTSLTQDDLKFLHEYVGKLRRP